MAVSVSRLSCDHLTSCSPSACVVSSDVRKLQGGRGGLVMFLFRKIVTSARSLLTLPPIWPPCSARSPHSKAHLPLLGVHTKYRAQVSGAGIDHEEPSGDGCWKKFTKLESWKWFASNVLSCCSGGSSCILQLRLPGGLVFWSASILCSFF